MSSLNPGSVFLEEKEGISVSCSFLYPILCWVLPFLGEAGEFYRETERKKEALSESD